MSDPRLEAWFSESPETRSFVVSRGKAVGVQTTIILRDGPIEVHAEDESTDKALDNAFLELTATKEP